jgi:very-short-patch-repair endonuclease
MKNPLRKINENSFPTVKLSQVLTESKIESLSLDISKRLRVRLNTNGVEKRPETNEIEGATKYYVRKAGQFVYGRQNLHKGAFGIVPQELDGFESSADIPAFDVAENCIPEWIDLFLKQDNYYQQLSKLASGVGSKRISPEKFLNLEIPLPALSKQKEILDKISNNKINLQKLSSDLNFQQTLLKKLRQQILQEAIEGKLTADWRAKNSPPCQGGVARSDGVVINNLPHLKYFRKALRQNLTPAEAKLWTYLKGKQLQGRKFRRQHSVGNYILDFYCPSEKLAIELDGEVHNTVQAAEYDKERDLFLANTGIKVLRFENKVVFQNPEGLLGEVEKWFGENPSAPSGHLPLPGEEFEPASELLKRIAAEKAQLIKDGKLKPQKPLPPISEEEKPFELPEGWAWCRLGDISINSLGKMLDQQKNKGIPKPYLRNLNVQWHQVNADDLKEMRFEDHETEKYTVKKGDIVICEGGYPGQAAIWRNDWDVMFQKALHRVRFIYSCFDSELFVNLLWLWDVNGEIQKYFTGAGIKHLTGKSLNRLLIPLSPLVEQKAIVNKVEKLLSICDKLEAQINQNQSHAEQLMQAVLKEAFQSITTQNYE